MNSVSFLKNFLMGVYKLKHSFQKLILKFEVIAPESPTISINNQLLFWTLIGVPIWCYSQFLPLISIPEFYPDIHGVVTWVLWQCTKIGKGSQRMSKPECHHFQIHVMNNSIFYFMVAKLRSKISKNSTSTLP